MTIAQEQSRCPAINTLKSGCREVTVQCIFTTGTVHGTHAGWAGAQRVTWSAVPSGPVTPDDWRAAAWELTGSLGLEMYWSQFDNLVVVDRYALARWWERQDRTNLVRVWRESQEKS